MVVHVAFAACEVYYATQSSIGTDVLLEPEGRLRSYREFCDLLAEPDRRVWADPLFLDDSLAGGASLRARWGAEL
ncbi:hypothetical protein [Streptomyces sp. NPDC005209]|uniref:hypothetical protein n=1 Tax=Streptomyces sp. NPDC005209 TaxID=3156715 RepID=UPI0033B43974